MPFQPVVGLKLAIDKVNYSIAEHPAAPGIPYGQEGRAAIVYQLVTQGGEKKALKVFRLRYRVPALVTLADNLAPFATFSGLAVCRRSVLSARRHGTLLRQHPDLTYAVLMPWVEGPTWVEVVLEERTLSAEQSLDLARSLVDILVEMEEHGLAHCDLSGPNVLLPTLASGEGVALVDVEGMYGPELRRPQEVLSGSAGYAHRTTLHGLWGVDADRFAGAVLLAEMLGWCDERVRQAAWGESYFEPQEMQEDSNRYRLLIDVMRERWGTSVAGCLERAWDSETLADCPTFGEWLVTLPEKVPQPTSLTVSPEVIGKHQESVAEEALQVLMGLTHHFEGQDDLESALQTHQAREVVTERDSSVDESARTIRNLEANLRQDTILEQEPLSEEKTNLDRLFEEGFQAYEREEWARAQELLAEVVRQKADYQRGTQRASRLLEQALQQQVPPSKAKKVPVWAWLMAATIGMVLVWTVVNAVATSPPPTSTPTSKPSLTITGVGTGPCYGFQEMFNGGIRRLYGCFQYYLMETGMLWEWGFYLNGAQKFTQSETWDRDAEGQIHRSYQPEGGFAAGDWEFRVCLAGQGCQSKTFQVSEPSIPTATHTPTLTPTPKSNQSPARLIFNIEYLGCQPHDFGLGSVKGQVFDRQGKVIYGAEVEIWIDGARWNSPANPAKTNEEGWYEWVLGLNQTVRFVGLYVGGRQVTFVPQNFEVVSQVGCFQRVNFRQR